MPKIDYRQLFTESVEIWSEYDSGTPDRERLDAALERMFPHLRIFGLARIDFEDISCSFYSRGSIYIISGYCPEGGFIRVVKRPR
jgi:hypothetical protein